MAEGGGPAVTLDRVKGLMGVLPYAIDPAAATRLWQVSEELLATGAK